MKFKEFDKPEYFVNRELSWIKFDDRVLSEARDKNLPLFERLKFLSITSSNLDEFYMVRVASLKDQVHVGYKKTDIAGMTAKEQLKAISQQTHDLVHVQYSTLNRSLVPALEKAGLHVIFEHEAFSEKQKEFVDRYFMAILSEAMQDGLVKGYLDGDGKTGPIGIFRQIGTTNDDGTNKAKTVLNNITKFSPKGLANVRKTLTKNGKRVVTKLYLICNPADEAEYVDPCMFGEALTGGYVNKTFIDIEKIPDANCPQGKAAFTIDGHYTMGATGVRVTEYDQTKAMENADLIIANCFANGRADDDNVAVIFNVTKLEEYVINVHQTSTASV